jgi:hypothetical protein
MFDLCMTDTELTSEEKQVFDVLEQVADDMHPDAHACRLKMLLMTSESPMAAKWDLGRELHAYLEKQHLVSAECRLTVEEERDLLESAHGTRTHARTDLRLSRPTSASLSLASCSFP